MFSVKQKYYNERDAESENVRLMIRLGLYPSKGIFTWKDFHNPAWAAANEIIQDTTQDYTKLDETFEYFTKLAIKEWGIWINHS